MDTPAGDAGGLGCKEIRQIAGDRNGRRSRVPSGRRHVR